MRTVLIVASGLLLFVLVCAGVGLWYYRPTIEYAYGEVFELDNTAPIPKSWPFPLPPGAGQGVAKPFETVVSEHPTSAAAHYNLGVIYQALGDFALAERQYREALRLNPTHTLSSRALSTLLSRAAASGPPSAPGTRSVSGSSSAPVSPTP